MALCFAIYCPKWRNKMNTEISQNESLFYRTLLALGMILLAAALRIAPHPWNFTPVGAMALFSGAVLRDRRLAFLFPLLTLFLGDIVIGFHKLVPIVYASFLLSVLIGRPLQNRRTILRIGAATLLGSVQFFWNTLAGDAFYSALLFGAYALAERFIPALHVSGGRASA